MFSPVISQMLYWSSTVLCYIPDCKFFLAQAWYFLFSNAWNEWLSPESQQESVYRTHTHPIYFYRTLSCFVTLSGCLQIESRYTALAFALFSFYSFLQFASIFCTVNGYDWETGWHWYMTIRSLGPSKVLQLRSEKRKKLTSYCWFVCPVQHSCNFQAAYQSEVTRLYHSHQRSPQQSSHLTDPEPHHSYCAWAGHPDTVQRNRKPVKIQEIQEHSLNLEFSPLHWNTTSDTK